MNDDKRPNNDVYEELTMLDVVCTISTVISVVGTAIIGVLYLIGEVLL